MKKLNIDYIDANIKKIAYHYNKLLITLKKQKWYHPKTTLHIYATKEDYKPPVIVHINKGCYYENVVINKDGPEYLYFKHLIEKYEDSDYAKELFT